MGIHLYVDEFQNFATQSFVQLLSEARKYKLFLTMAEQSTAQQEERRFIDIILANVGTVICFRSGSPIDEQLLLPLFSPYVQKGEIANLSAYKFYAKLSGMRAQEPMSGESVVTSEDEASDERAEEVVAESRERWAIEYEDEAEQKASDKDVRTKPEENEKATEDDDPRSDDGEQDGEGGGLIGVDTPLAG